MNIQDDKQFTIYEKEINGVKYYRLQMSKKVQDGSYQNGYIDVKFAKCEPPKNRDRIYLKRAWISFYLSKDKHTIPYVVCTEYETTEQVIRDSKKDIVKQEVKEDNPDDLFKEFGEEHKDDEFELPF
jgi:hypothetical protein